MHRIRKCLSWGLATVAVMLSPIVLIFGLPLAIGVGLDIFGRAGEGPVVAALCGPAALVLLARAVSRMALLQTVAAWAMRPHFGRPARLH